MVSWAGAGKSACRRRARGNYSDSDAARSEDHPMPVLQTALLDHVHRLLPPQDADAELLASFTARRDQAAFAALVRRHGPMVLRLCRRLLGEVHAAEDCFQATFLALACRAGSIRRPAAVAAWLYGVAYRVSLRTRAERGRRRALASAADLVTCPDP